VEFDLFSEIWDAIVRFYGDHEPVIRVVSYVVSPILALLAFLWNRKDRTEIIVKSTELGRLEVEVDHAHAQVRDEQDKLQAAQAELGRRGSQIAKLEDDLHKITDSSNSLWTLRPAPSFDSYKASLWDPGGARIITIGNLKGGVGKTTLAANFAAYVSETLEEDVLLIDLDFQGSLSNMLMLAIEREDVPSNVDKLFDPNANLITLEEANVHLAKKLKRGWLVPANYGFAQVENRLLLTWLLQSDGGVDVRHRLANVLLRSEIRRSYKVIVLDMPPRMTLGTVNALVTSHFFFVPTILDSLSAEAVGQFVTSVKQVKLDLGLEIDLKGIIGCMTRQAEPRGNEIRALELCRKAGHLWKPDEDYVLKATLPRKVDIGSASGVDVAYFGKDGQGVPLRNWFDPLFEEMCEKIFPAK
jgi:chromosome partitioning protein